MPISVQNITKSFDNLNVLQNISFELSKGEIVGLLGLSGSGKSTLMGILATDLQADSGEARINGCDVRTEKQNVQKSIGYLPEHENVNVDTSINEYLTSRFDLETTNKSRITEVIEQTGLTPVLHTPIKRLSKANRQHLSLAGAILNDPAVLLLDEPTKGFDFNHQLEIRKLIRTVSKDKTVLLSTSTLQEVKAICDRVLILKDGILVADKPLSYLHNDREQIIEVEFDYRVEKVFLNKLEYASNVENTSGFIYEVTFHTTKDMRPTVFDFAHDNSLKIVQLGRKNVSLEHLFAELTE